MKKPSLPKSLQFDEEPQKDSSTEAQSSEHPVPSSLLHLIGHVAETAEDKYRLLEQRDKILRQGNANCLPDPLWPLSWQKTRKTLIAQIICLHRSTQEDGLGHVQGVCWDVSWHVSREGEVYEGDSETAECIRGHPKYWDGNVFNIYVLQSDWMYFSFSWVSTVKCFIVSVARLQRKKSHLIPKLNETVTSCPGLGGSHGSHKRVQPLISWPGGAPSPRVAPPSCAQHDYGLPGDSDHGSGPWQLPGLVWLCLEQDSWHP